MKNLKSLLGLTALALAFAVSGHKAAAQGGFGGGPGGGGGFGAMLGDPAQRAQLQVNALRDSLVVTNDAEWNVIAARLLKVVQLKSDNSMAEIAKMMAPMMAMMGGGMGGGMADLLGIKPDRTADALQQALDNKGTLEQVKAALAKFREAKKQKLAELAKAQDALKEVLTIRQEAALVAAGYLD